MAPTMTRTRTNRSRIDAAGGDAGSKIDRFSGRAAVASSKPEPMSVTPETGCPQTARLLHEARRGLIDQPDQLAFRRPHPRRRPLRDAHLAAQHVVERLGLARPRDEEE